MIAAMMMNDILDSNYNETSEIYQQLCNQIHLIQAKIALIKSDLELLGCNRYPLHGNIFKSYMHRVMNSFINLVSHNNSDSDTSAITDIPMVTNATIIRNTLIVVVTASVGIFILSMYILYHRKRKSNSREKIVDLPQYQLSWSESSTSSTFKPLSLHLSFLDYTVDKSNISIIFTVFDICTRIGSNDSSSTTTSKAAMVTYEYSYTNYSRCNTSEVLQYAKQNYVSYRFEAMIDFDKEKSVSIDVPNGACTSLLLLTIVRKVSDKSYKIYGQSIVSMRSLMSRASNTSTVHRPFSIVYLPVTCNNIIPWYHVRTQSSLKTHSNDYTVDDKHAHTAFATIVMSIKRHKFSWYNFIDAYNGSTLPVSPSATTTTACTTAISSSSFGSRISYKTAARHEYNDGYMYLKKDKHDGDDVDVDAVGAIFVVVTNINYSLPIVISKNASFSSNFISILATDIVGFFYYNFENVPTGLRNKYFDIEVQFNDREGTGSNNSVLILLTNEEMIWRKWIKLIALTSKLSYSIEIKSNRHRFITTNCNLLQQTSLKTPSDGTANVVCVSRHHTIITSSPL